MKNPVLWKTIEAYVAAHEIDIGDLRFLGDGNDGEVWKTDKSAVKVVSRHWNYIQERTCYQRLSAKGVREICGLQIPRLESFDDTLQIIQMGIVTPPFLLDFGKTYIDTPPDYPEDHSSDLESRLVEMFGDDTKQVKRVLRKLESHGIYYVDPNPGNIKFRPDDE